ncbi:MAG: type IV toxin-antitoxin system AbiEi family antitoxin domain-containing protein [Thermoplasmatales archaeon]|nr:type IV toxin-antitoxin system AbiEi family antitoxin domain-containing protein [Candidatus Thermoplasmatota archaeon]MCG2827118.1 type IV toxin-antitoxin system AbiEi family antitoxin domain-containing protein [Thermoplasmatales archaeon]
MSMDKTDKLYAFAMERKIVTSDELAQFAENIFGKNYQYLYIKYLRRLMADGRLKRVRRGTYAAVNIYEKQRPPPDKYLIGAKLRGTYYLGYHTALELHGSAYSAYNSCYVAAPDNMKFRPFKYDNLSFKSVVTRNLKTEIHTLKYLGQDIHISSPSRTFVECVYRPDLCGGYEEAVKSLDGLGGTTAKGILASLALYKKDSLYRAVGYFLEWMIKNSPYYGHIRDGDLEKICSSIGKKPTYLMKCKKTKIIERWNIYVPKNFEEMFLGVR